MVWDNLLIESHSIDIATTVCIHLVGLYTKIFIVYKPFIKNL